MIWTIRRRPAAWLLLVLGGLGISACGALDVSDPTAVEEGEIQDAAGADLMRRNVLLRMNAAVLDGALASGLLSDEFLFDRPEFDQLQDPDGSEEDLLDRRRSQRYEDLVTRNGGGLYLRWQEVRRAATLAIPYVRGYTPEPPRAAYLGQMFAVRGLVALRLAADFCPGFPLHDVVDYTPVYGPPLTTDEALQKALTDFDSALVYAVDSARILHFAEMGRARTLLALGRFEEAGTIAALVPTEFVWNADYEGNGLSFANTFPMFARSIADEEGGNGLNFVSADDPRIQATQYGTAQDGVTGVYYAGKYDSPTAPIVVASGIEARLIDAEAALHADPGSSTWLTILNTLRTDGTQDGDGVYQPGTGGVAGLAPLADPGTDAARVDLLFRERAFWLFGTGHRLADLRRLVRQYGRNSEDVFPTGAYRLGGMYESGTSIPFPAGLEAPFNPAITGCTSR